MLDFNEALAPVSPATSQIDFEALRAELLGRLHEVLSALFPAGKVVLGKFLMGDVMGNSGRSLEVVLDGDKAGLWMDRATGDGGDIFALIGAHFGIDPHHDFPKVMRHCSELLGRAPAQPPQKQRRQPPTDDLGPATAKWDYLTADGKLIAVVYRYDPPGRKKEFRPYNPRTGKHSPPNPRPLYNQPGIAQAQTVILVEGEKSAQALIDAGICATTAMHGANAPVDKTDWSPLAGKTVLIWPDRDKPGYAYAEKAAQAMLAAGVGSVAILHPPADKAEGWDAADGLAETPPFDVAGFIVAGERMPVTPDFDQTSSPASLFAKVDATTEDGLATAFTRRYRDDWRHVTLWGKWLVWNGVRWNHDQTDYVRHLIRQVCRAASHKADTPRLKTKLASASTAAAVERFARADPDHATTAEVWDADPWLINTPAGVVDLRSGNTRPHRREDRMTKVTTATPHGTCPLWLGFLADVTGGDAELMSYLQRVIGYCLTGITSEHALFFLYGTGANGKSVFVNVITTILGDYAANAPMDTFMETRSDRHPTDLAGLRGARFVSSIETEQGRRWNESKVKAITGGDKISARFMRQDFFEYTPQFKLVIAGNHKPSIRNVDEAMKRRLHLIPFTVTIPSEKRDGKLTGKLLKERDGILAWAVEGCRLWQHQGLKVPASVVSATEEYFENEDALGQWIEERCNLHPEARTLSADLYGDWREWSEKTGEFVGSIKRFAELLIARGFEKTRMHGGAKAFKGLMLKPKVCNQHYTDTD